jgi:hypothetical protein
MIAKLKTFAATLAGKIIFGLVVVLAVLLFLQVRSCTQSAQHAAQARVDQGQGNAFHWSASEAINIQSAVNANTVNSADISRQNEENIRHAQGSAQPVDPAANAGGLLALCRRASHAHDPACGMQQPHPR